MNESVYLFLNVKSEEVIHKGASGLALYLKRDSGLALYLKRDSGSALYLETDSG